MQSNYIVKYVGTEKYKVFSQGLVTLLFDEKNEYSVDVLEECKKQLNLNPDSIEFKNRLKDLYINLIKKDFIPYYTMESVKNFALEIRNNKILRPLRENYHKTLFDLEKEKEQKINEIQENYEKDLKEKEQKTIEELNIQMNVLEMERSKFYKIKQDLSNTDNEENRFKLNSEMEEKYKDLELNNVKLERLKNNLSGYIEEFKQQTNKKISDISDLYAKMVLDEKLKYENEVTSYISAFESRKKQEFKSFDEAISIKDKELKKKDVVLNVDRELIIKQIEEKGIEITPEILKMKNVDLVVLLNSDVVKTVEDKINE